MVFIEPEPLALESPTVYCTVTTWTSKSQAFYCTRTICKPKTVQFTSKNSIIHAVYCTHYSKALSKSLFEITFGLLLNQVRIILLYLA